MLRSFMLHLFNVMSVVIKKIKKKLRARVNTMQQNSCGGDFIKGKGT